MKITRETFEETIIGAEKQSSFSINTDSSIIFEILRNKMYSNKIGSICREIASNARDANREAGRGHIAIDITIVAPEQAEDQFGIMVTDECIIFGDNGIGINPERMEDVFIVYGTSTKSTDNSQTGGFGLGAKTPFAYTDSFTIVTTCDYEGKRMQYTYTAILDQSQKGKMILFDSIEVENDLATGTKIIIPINGDDDRRSFEREVVQCTQLWETRPNLAGFICQYPTMKVLESFVDQEGEQRVSIVQITDEWGNPLYPELHVFSIDGIIYPISYAQLPQELSFLRQLSPVTIKQKGKESIQVNASCILHFDTGELSVSANREQLQFDTRTIESIDAVYSTFISQLSDRIQQVIDEFESLPIVDRAQLLQEYKTKIQVDASFFQGKNKAMFDIRLKELEVGARININKLHLMNYFTSTPLVFSTTISNQNELQQHHYKKEKSKSIVKLFGQPHLACFLKHVVITKEGGRSHYLRNNAVANHISDITLKISLSFTVIAVPKECDEKMYCQIIELITYLQSIGTNVMYYEDFDKASVYKHLVVDQDNAQNQGSPYKKKQILEVLIAFFGKEGKIQREYVNWDRSTGLLDISPIMKDITSNANIGNLNIVYQEISSLSTATEYSEDAFERFTNRYKEKTEYLFNEQKTLLIFVTPKTINYQLQNYKNLNQFIEDEQLSVYKMDEMEKLVRQQSWMHNALLNILPKWISFAGQRSLIEALINTIPSKDHQYVYRQYITRQMQLCEQMGLQHTFTNLINKIEVKYNPFAESSYEVQPSEFDRSCDQMFEKINTSTFYRFREAIDRLKHYEGTSLSELSRINDLKSKFTLDRINNTPIKLTATRRHQLFQ